MHVLLQKRPCSHSRATRVLKKQSVVPYKRFAQSEVKQFQRLRLGKLIRQGFWPAEITVCDCCELMRATMLTSHQVQTLLEAACDVWATFFIQNSTKPLWAASPVRCIVSGLAASILRAFRTTMWWSKASVGRADMSNHDASTASSCQSVCNTESVYEMSLSGTVVCVGSQGRNSGPYAFLSGVLVPRVVGCQALEVCLDEHI